MQKIIFDFVIFNLHLISLIDYLLWRK